MDAGLLVGSCTKAVLDEVIHLILGAMPEGYVVVAEPRSETGFLIPYHERKGSELVDLDGIFLRRILTKSKR